MKIKSFTYLLIGLPLICFAAETEEVIAESIRVPAPRSFNGEAFSYTRALKVRVRNHTVYSVTYPSPVKSDMPENNTVPAELYLPVGLKPDSKVPAVICMHILNGDFALCRMMCSRLSEVGIVAMFFMQPYYGARGGRIGRKALLKSSDVLISGFEQSNADAQRAFDIIQSQSGVDPDKCGVTGISLGAIRAGALCSYETRVKRAYLALVAGDLKNIIMSARESRALKAFIMSRAESEQERVWEYMKSQDPLNAVPSLKRMAKAGRLRMIRAEKDQILPPECSIRLFDAVGFPESTICLKGMGHYSAMAGLAGIMDDLTEFFAEDMPKDWKPRRVEEKLTPIALLGGFIKDISDLIAANPKAGHAHMAGVQMEMRVNGKNIKSEFDLTLGENGCFKIRGVFPEVGRAGLGRGSYPWIIGGEKKVFCGTQSSDPELKLEDLIGAESMLRYRMLAGLMAGASLSPDLMNNYAKTSVSSGDGGRVLKLTGVGKKFKGSVDIVFDISGRYLKRVLWDIGDSAGTLEFTHWQINAAAHQSLFEPDETLVRREVPQGDVIQMFASVFQFVTDSI